MRKNYIEIGRLASKNTLRGHNLKASGVATAISERGP
jgi:hypothetical protein